MYRPSEFTDPHITPTMSALAHYCQRVEAAVSRKDGESLRSLLRDSTEDTVAAINEFYSVNGDLPLNPAPDWVLLPQVVQCCFTAAGAIRMNDWVDAFDHICTALNSYMQILANETDWSLPLFHQLCEDVRVIAQVADDQLREDHRKPCKLEAAERILKRGFTIVNNDRAGMDHGSRRIGALGIINQLLKVYFKINNLGLCVNLTRTVGTSNFPEFESFPLRHRVTYKYYAGRLSLYDDRYSQAVDDLTYALKHTPIDEGENRRRILLYLIPSKILTGSLPKKSTLETYRMKWYTDIVAAIKTGNLQLFENAVAAYEEFFIKSALYLAIEKMKSLVYRALVRQVANITGVQKIPLDHVIVGIRLCRITMDRDEVECILANLIHQSYIKGYISHKVGFLVLSRTNPFPKLNSLA